MDILNTLSIIFFGTSLGWGTVQGFLLVAGYYLLFKKSKVKAWVAIIPGFRNWMLGRIADRESEGRVICFLDILSMMFVLIGGTPKVTGADGSLQSVLLVLLLTVTVVLLIFYIRIYLSLIRIYDVSKWWIVILVFAEWPVFIFWGLNPRYQPSWVPGDREKPSRHQDENLKAMSEGLTVNLKERSVTELFTRRVLLSNIHLYIRPGRMVLLLGGSGAGKTTFVNAVNGYEKANAKMTLNGTDLYRNYKQMQYQVGFVPQQELMRGKDTVYRTLMDASLLRMSTDFSAADRRERVQHVMELFGLKAIEDSLVEKLSGGQKKRLSIAMEFISDPSLFILDEPDSGLDGVMARELMENLRKIADEGKIVMVITHTPDRVIDLFDDVIVLAKDTHRTGRLAFYGSIEEARTFFGRETMEEIVMCINREEEGGEGRADEFIAKYAEVQHA